MDTQLQVKIYTPRTKAVTFRAKNRQIIRDYAVTLISTRNEMVRYVQVWEVYFLEKLTRDDHLNIVFQNFSHIMGVLIRNYYIVPQSAKF